MRETLYAILTKTVHADRLGTQSFRLSRRQAPLVRFNMIGREDNRINNRNNGPSPENNRGGVRQQIKLEVPKSWVTTALVPRFFFFFFLQN